MGVPKVLVFVATYNGEKYLKEQLNSILNQKGVLVDILVADDCSTDNTPSILEEYKSKFTNVDFYINKENKRFTYNFIDCIFNSKDSDYEYYAISDQDDYWLDNKLISAIQMINVKANEPILYCSNLMVADSDLKEIGLLEDSSIAKTNKYTYIFENICTGCTIVFNKAFHSRILEYYPSNIYLHDYWLFLIAVFTANFIYDKNAYILYRQHGDNQIGAKSSNTLNANFKRWKKSIPYPSILCGELLKGYSKYISDEDKKIVSTMVDYKKKIGLKFRLIFSKRFRKRKKNLTKNIKILFNKY